MIASFLEGIEHSLDDKQVSSLAGRLPGWSGSDIQVCLPELMNPPGPDLNGGRIARVGSYIRTFLRHPYFLEPSCCREMFGR